jgi:hypothetical protein
MKPNLLVGQTSHDQPSPGKVLRDLEGVASWLMMLIYIVTVIEQYADLRDLHLVVKITGPS